MMQSSTFPGNVRLKFEFSAPRDRRRIADARAAGYLTDGFGIRDGDTVIDIGAHIGTFTVYAAKLAGRGAVYSFEPHPENFRLLKKNVSLNGLKNVRLSRTGVSGGGGECALFTDEENTGGHSIYGKGGRQLRIRCTTLSDILSSNSIDSCDFLKMDCEGAEYGILFGTPPECFDRIRKMVLEYHEYFFGRKRLRHLVIFLGKMGFRVSVRPITKRQGIIYARNMRRKSPLGIMLANHLGLQARCSRLAPALAALERCVGLFGLFLKKRSPGTYAELRRLKEKSGGGTS